MALSGCGGDIYGSRANVQLSDRVVLHGGKAHEGVAVCLDARSTGRGQGHATVRPGRVLGHDPGLAK
eukprot:1061803-Rhodomonas_salina.1